MSSSSPPPEFPPPRPGLPAWVRQAAFALGVCSCLLLPASSRSLGQVTFTKIADTNTEILNGSGNYTGFGVLPGVSGGVVVFRGAGSSGQQGVYTGSGSTLTVIANTNTSIPGGSGTFTSLTTASISGTTVAFKGGGTGQQGVYTSIGGTLSAVANLGTAVPDSSGNFTDFNTLAPPAVSGSHVAFVGTSSAQTGVYFHNGTTLAKVANTSTVVPGGNGGTFTSFGIQTTLSGTTTVFRGVGGGQVGIYSGTTSTVSMLANLTTDIPNGTGDFTNLYGESIDGGSVVFQGTGNSGQAGIYTVTNGIVVKVANTNTPVPSGTGNFTVFDVSSSFYPGPDISDGVVVFKGRSSGSSSGIYYANADGTGAVSKVIAPGDTIDGLTVSSVNFSQFGFEDSKLAFFVVFTNGTQGIYMADLSPVPEPAWLLLVVAAGLLARAGIPRSADPTPAPESPRTGIRGLRLFWGGEQPGPDVPWQEVGRVHDPYQR